MKKNKLTVEIKLQFSNEFLIGGGIGEQEHHVGIIKNINGYPYIPASAFKGKLKYYYDLIMPLILNDINKEDVKKLKKYIFGGTTNYRGILKFTDFKIKNEDESLKNNKFVDTTLKRTSVAINRFTKTKIDGALFTTETSSIAGAGELEGKLFCYCTDKEIEIFVPVLFAAFRMMNSFGGRKSTGLGWLEKEPEVEFKINDELLTKNKILLMAENINKNIKEYTNKSTSPNEDVFKPKDMPTNYKFAYKIIVKQKSDLLIGGKKLNNNFLVSQKEIPGSVLKAGLAKVIDEQCPYTNRVSNKKHWVCFANKKLCEQCDFKDMCIQFDTIFTGALRTNGARVLPLTAYRCKYYKIKKCDKKLYDIVISLIKKNEKEFKDNNIFNCCCGSKTERIRGFYKEGKRYDPLTNFVTKSSIYSKTLSSKAGDLYSLLGLNGNVSIEDLNSGDISEDKNIFEGIVKTEEQLELKKFTAFIGKSNSAGFGRCEVELKNTELKEKKLIDRLKEFNNLIDSKKNNYYYTVTLLTNAILSIKSNANPLKDVLDSFEGELLFEFKEEEMIRGFDTSNSADKGFLKEKRGVIKAGSVFVFKIDKKTGLDVLANKLEILEKKSIGEDIILGFGAIKICDEFHIRGV